MNKRNFMIIYFLLVSIIFCSLISCSENDNHFIPSDLITLTVDTSEYVESGIIRLDFFDNTMENLTADYNYIHKGDSIHIYKLINGMWQHAVTIKSDNNEESDEARKIAESYAYENRKLTIQIILDSELYDYDFSAGDYLIVQEGKFQNIGISNTVHAVFELPERES